MLEHASKKIEISFADRMRAARQKLGISQREAAERWGFDLGTLRAWEQEFRHPFGLYRDKLEAVLTEVESR